MAVPAEKTSTLIFLCVANSARSQMAEGLARHSAPAGWRILSAGSQPGLVHPLATRVMREIGIDISDQPSKGLADIPLDEADVIITLCAEEVCPVAPGEAEQLHWALPDPVGQGETHVNQIDTFRSVRDEIQQRLASFWCGRRAQGTGCRSS